MSLQKSHWAQSSVLLQGSHSPHIRTERFTWGQANSRRWEPLHPLQNVLFIAYKMDQCCCNTSRPFGTFNVTHRFCILTSYNTCLSIFLIPLRYCNEAQIIRSGNITYFRPTPPFTPVVWSTGSAVLLFSSVELSILFSVFLWSILYFQRGVLVWRQWE